jgi:hypothetical protein
MRQFWIGVAASALLTVVVPTASQAQTAGVPEPSAQQIELAHRVMADIGGEKMIDQLMNGMTASMIEQMSKGQPKDVQDAFRTILTPSVQATMTRIMPKMIQVMDNAYAENFTEQELTDIDAFYRSPSGRAMIAKMPQVATSTMQAAAPLQVEIRRDLAEEVCKRTTCSAAMRAGIAGEPTPTK